MGSKRLRQSKLNKKSTRKLAKNYELGTGLNKEEMKEWIYFQTKIQYNEEASKTYSSLKGVLKRRHQFSKKAIEKKEKYDKQIFYKDKELYKSCYVNISNSKKKGEQNQTLDRDDRDEDDEDEK